MNTVSPRVHGAVPEFLLDLLLPATDRAVAIQWSIMIPFWVVALVAVRRQNRDVRTFVLGLAIINLAWFAARTIH